MGRCVLAALAVLVLTVGGLARGHASEPPPQLELCAACHGAQAPSPFPNVPTIQGMPVAVLDNALYDFRATIRPCRKPDCGPDRNCPQIDFCGLVAGLSDEDIGALAAWYAAQPFAPVSQAWDAELASAGRLLHEAQCESCHAGGGATPVDQAGLLRGQPKGYLRIALEDFRQERRVAVAEMDALIRALTDEQLDALVEFYASPRP
jgi:cytochrome subunit of sulfide dehydrogenase